MQINTEFGLVEIQNDYTHVVATFPAAMPLEELSRHLDRFNVMVTEKNVQSSGEGRLTGRFYKRFMLAGFAS